jgi:serine/threonine protein phosphatase PrpC
LSNSLGSDHLTINQGGQENLKSGDRIVFCTDGVTGDNPDEEMSSEEIARLVTEASGPEEAAQRLVRDARKIDDRTAIVVSV